MIYLIMGRYFRIKIGGMFDGITEKRTGEKQKQI